MTSNNMYRVGDFVYFEVSASAPYQIRKIEELNKTPTGAVEAKVVCFYRRRDLSSNLIQLADKHQKELGLSDDDSQPESLHQIRHRELFLSRHLETLPATHIRGKCTVILHTESEPYHIYLPKEDAFFFQLVYDPFQKTLQADRGTIREGSSYQAEVSPYVSVNEFSSGEDNNTEKNYEELLWKPNNGLSTEDFNLYLLLIRSLATFGRAFHLPHVLRQPNLHMSAAAAGRDTTHQFALDTLHSCNYDVKCALQSLTSIGQLVLKYDEMEQWSASEGNLFEEALEKYGKCFNEIQNDFLPWKRPKSLVEFYYMWKTTDNYIQQKRMKAVEAEHHLKQVYIPNYNKPNPTVLYPVTDLTDTVSSGCEGCTNTVSTQWYALGSSNAPLKVCTDCWAYWKRYGDLKSRSVLDKVIDSAPNSTKPSHIDDSFGLESVADPMSLESGLSAQNATSKARAGSNFQFVASLALRIARRLCGKGDNDAICGAPLNAKRQAREPFRRLTLLTTLHKDTYSTIAKLTPAQLVVMGNRLKNSRALTNDKSGMTLNKLIERSFPSGVSKLANSNSLSTAKVVNNAAKTNNFSVAERLNSTGTTESALDLAINVAMASNLSGGLKRRASSPNEDTTITTTTTTNTTCTSLSKRPNTMQVFSQNSSVNRGPKRRLGIDPGCETVCTLMYRVTSTIKHSRRGLLSISDLRRFGRRPWCKNSVDARRKNGTHNGLPNSPTTSSSGKCLKRKQTAESVTSDDASLEFAVGTNSSNGKSLKP